MMAVAKVQWDRIFPTVGHERIPPELLTGVSRCGKI